MSYKMFFSCKLENIIVIMVIKTLSFHFLNIEIHFRVGDIYIQQFYIGQIVCSHFRNQSTWFFIYCSIDINPVNPI